MTTPIRSQTIFLDSSKALGSSSSWGITLDSGLVSCGPDEELSISIERFSCLSSWSWMPAGKSFVFYDASGLDAVTVALPAGNPTLQDLAAGITNEIAATRPNFTCIYEVTTGSLLFTSNVTMSLVFPDLATAKLLGFTTLTPISFNTYNGDKIRAWWGDGTCDDAIRSDFPLVPLAFRSINVGVSGFSPVCHSINNSGPSGSMQTCDTLTVIPVDAAPQTWLDYRNVPGANQMRVADKQLTMLHFNFTDDFGSPIVALPSQQFLQLRVDTYKTFDSTCVLLSNILRTLQLVAISHSRTA